MIKPGQDIVQGIHKKWILRYWLEILLYSLGISVFIYGLSKHLVYTVLGFIATVLFFLWYLKPWKYDLEHVCNYLDTIQPELEYSTSLVLEKEGEMSLLARLQKEKVRQQLIEIQGQLKPERNLKTALVSCLVFIFLGICVHYLGVSKLIMKSPPTETKQNIIFKAVDSTLSNIDKPSIIHQRVSIQYPAYTRQKVRFSTDMHIKELQGAMITWELQFDKTISQVMVQQLDEKHEMAFSKNNYRHTLKLETSGFYNFKFVDTLGNEYFSELYGIEAIMDQVPELEVKGLSQFTSFDVDQIKELNFEALVSDDYGISNAAIIATVSKGSGESVKFREEKLSFDNEFQKGAKKMVLRKSINLDQMEMSPGDELYFYVEVYDVKDPEPNITRGETYFANIRDTITDVFEVEGGMGVDQMPDYFRSQRQLIIDTEKLIKEKPLLTKSEFNAKSNELAFDQKALRIKYGEFMGDESTLGINSEDEAHNEEEEENLLAEFEHAHDTENESNLVEDDHDDHDDHEEHEEETEEDPLHDYLHDHGDPEEATLFSKSLKAQLRMALNEMWDAELHLRLYHPEESLPVQYRILKRLQEIKNSARIYVHRIGFDPPPIKEDKRLTGDLEEVHSYEKSAELTKPVAYLAIRASIKRIEEIRINQAAISEKDQILFETAGLELGSLAIEQPGKYLETLQALKSLSQGFNATSSELLGIQNGLILALPKPQSIPDKLNEDHGELNALFIKQLAEND